MKLDLIKFEAGLTEGDETHWCEPMVNNGPEFTEAMGVDLQRLEFPTDLNLNDTKRLADAYSTLFEVCQLANAQDYLAEDSYWNAFETLAELREIIIEQWP
jgi:hypothetical protein